MSDRLAPPTYRLLAPRATAGTAPESGDDLANLDTTALPNRAMCWGAATLWQLDKSMSGVTILVGSVAIQVAPNSGPGLWLPVAGEEATPLSFSLSKPDNSAAGSFADSGLWTAYPNLAWTVDGAASILPFTLNNNGCVLTYSGPDRYYSVSAYTTFQLGEVTTSLQGFASFLLSRNDALIGTNTQTGFQANAAYAETIAAVFYAHCFMEGKFLMQDGDTLQPIGLRNAGGGQAAATLLSFRMLIQELEAA